jgi:hypothetical protein
MSSSCASESTGRSSRSATRPSRSSALPSRALSLNWPGSGRSENALLARNRVITVSASGIIRKRSKLRVARPGWWRHHAEPGIAARRRAIHQGIRTDPALERQSRSRTDAFARLRAVHGLRRRHRSQRPQSWPACARLVGALHIPGKIFANCGAAGLLARGRALSSIALASAHRCRMGIPHPRAFDPVLIPSDRIDSVPSGR